MMRSGKLRGHPRLGLVVSAIMGLALTVGLARRAGAAPGDLDPTFGTGGKVTTDFGGSDRASALLMQPDGKLVVVGGSNAGGSFNVVLARYMPGGTLDPNFGAGGKVTGGFGAGASALVMQPDGKLVVAGSSGGNAGNFALTRYNGDGTLDTSFDSTGPKPGTVTTDFGGLDGASALVLQPDGKLAAAGSSCAISCDFALARYNADGTLDPNFGAGGKVTTNNFFTHSFFAWASALVLQPDGKLVAAGSSGFSFALARYNTDGSLDTSFNPTGSIPGTVATTFGGDDQALALVLQPNGKLVAAGSSCASSCNFALARYNADGTLDPTFGSAHTGKVITDFGGDTDGASALVLQPDGKLVAAGDSNAGGCCNFVLARYNADGGLDLTFAAGGVATTNFGGSDEVSALVLQPDGKLVAAGSSCAISCDFALARYEGTTPTPVAAPARQLLNVATFVGPTVPPTPQQQQQTFRPTDPLLAGATYYDPAEACLGVPPAGVKFFVFTQEGQLILGRNRDTGGVSSTQIGTSKYQALLAGLAPGALPAGSYNLVFWVKDCTDTAVLVSEFVALRVLSP